MGVRVFSPPVTSATPFAEVHLVAHLRGVSAPAYVHLKRVRERDTFIPEW